MDIAALAVLGSGPGDAAGVRHIRRGPTSWLAMMAFWF
jgi:hypothetical protein